MIVVFDRAYDAPDYLCDFFGYQFFVEATTVNPTLKNGVIAEPDPGSMNKDQLKSYFTDYMPIKWGSALSAKLTKRYWELPHVIGKPVVLAIQDFHIPNAMSFSSGTLLPYLYGTSFNALYDLGVPFLFPLTKEIATRGVERPYPQDSSSRRTPNTSVP